AKPCPSRRTSAGRSLEARRTLRSRWAKPLSSSLKRNTTLQHHQPIRGRAAVAANAGDAAETGRVDIQVGVAPVWSIGKIDRVRTERQFDPLGDLDLLKQV